MTLRILLINPPWYSLFDQKHHSFHLGLGYLAAAGRSRGHTVGILDPDILQDGIHRSNRDTSSKHDRYVSRMEDMGDPVWERLREGIVRFQPDVVGVTVMTATLRSALNVARLAKSVDPGIPVLAGGVHATLRPDDLLRPGTVDCVIRGEGEAAFLEVLEEIGSGGPLPPRFPAPGTPPSLMPDLDVIPIPARDAILGVDGLSPLHMGHLFTSRGCPFRCCFCASYKMWTRRVRYRSIEGILTELRQVRQRFGTRFFYFEDDSFTLRPERVEAFCLELRKAGLGITWGCETRVDLVDPGLLRLMRRSGCRLLSIGAEAGSDDSLERMGKRITTAQVRRAVSRVQEAGIDTNVFFMIGFPWEEETDIRQTVDFFRELDPTYGVLSIATPYPGTPLFDLCAAEGLVDPDPDWTEFYHQSPRGLFNKKIPRERSGELIRYAQEVFDSHNTRSKKRKLLNPSYVLERMQQNRYYHPRKILGLLKYLLSER